METATAETKYLKLIDLSPAVHATADVIVKAVHATADVIVKAVTAYLEEKASPAPGLQNRSWSFCHGWERQWCDSSA